MHYNINERIKPKRNIPYKRIIVAILVVVAVVVGYLVATHDTANFQKPPTTTQREPA